MARRRVYSPALIHLTVAAAALAGVMSTFPSHPHHLYAYFTHAGHSCGKVVTSHFTNLAAPSLVWAMIYCLQGWHLSPALPVTRYPSFQVRDYTDVHVTGGRVAYPTAAAALQAIAARRGSSSSRGVETARDYSASRTTDKQGMKAEAAAAAEGVKSDIGAATMAASVKEEPMQAMKVEGGGTTPLEPPAAGPASWRVGQTRVRTSAAGAYASDDDIAAAVIPSGPAVCESCLISVRFMGYFRVWQGTGQTFDAVELFLPDTQYHTQVGGLAEGKEAWRRGGGDERRGEGGGREGEGMAGRGRIEGSR